MLPMSVQNIPANNILCLVLFKRFEVQLSVTVFGFFGGFGVVINIAGRGLE